jgi:type I restriction enzyme S subunit
LAYLCRVLEHYDVTPFATGTTRGKLTQAGASEIPIPLPPLAEQLRIAEILDRAEALRAKRRATLTQFDILIQAVFLDMFGDPATNPKRWPIHKIGDLLESVSYGTSEKSGATGEFPVLRMNNIYPHWRNELDRPQIYAVDCQT